MQHDILGDKTRSDLRDGIAAILVGPKLHVCFARRVVVNLFKQIDRRKAVKNALRGKLPRPGERAAAYPIEKLARANTAARLQARDRGPIGLAVFAENTLQRLPVSLIPELIVEIEESRIVRKAKPGKPRAIRWRAASEDTPSFAISAISSVVRAGPVRRRMSSILATEQYVTLLYL